MLTRTLVTKTRTRSRTCGTIRTRTRTRTRTWVSRTGQDRWLHLMARTSSRPK